MNLISRIHKLAKKTNKPTDNEKKDKNDCLPCDSTSEAAKIETNPVDESIVHDKQTSKEEKGDCFPVCSSYDIAKTAANLVEASSLTTPRIAIEEYRIPQLFYRYYKLLILNSGTPNIDESSIQFPTLSECESLEIASILTKASMARENNKSLRSRISSIKSDFGPHGDISPIAACNMTEEYFKSHYKFLTDRKWP